MTIQAYTRSGVVPRLVIWSLQGLSPRCAHAGGLCFATGPAAHREARRATGAGEGIPGYGPPKECNRSPGGQPRPPTGPKAEGLINHVGRKCGPSGAALTTTGLRPPGALGRGGTMDTDNPKGSLPVGGGGPEQGPSTLQAPAGLLPAAPAPRIQETG